MIDFDHLLAEFQRQRAVYRRGFTAQGGKLALLLKVDGQISNYEYVIERYRNASLKAYAVCMASMDGQFYGAGEDAFGVDVRRDHLSNGRYGEWVASRERLMDRLLALKNRRRDAIAGTGESASSVNAYARRLLSEAAREGDHELYAACMMDVEDSCRDIRAALDGRMDFGAREIEDGGDGPDDAAATPGAVEQQRPGASVLGEDGDDRGAPQRTKRQKDKDRKARRRAELASAAEPGETPAAEDAADVEEAVGASPDAGPRRLQDEIDEKVAAFIASKRAAPAEAEGGGEWRIVRGRENQALQVEIDRELEAERVKSRKNGARISELEGVKAGGAMMKRMNAKVRMYSGSGDEQKIYEHDYYDLAGNQWEHTTADGCGRYRNGKPTSKRPSFDRAMDPRNNSGRTYVLVASGRNGYRNQADIDHIRNNGGVVITKRDGGGITIAEEIGLVAEHLGRRRAFAGAR